MTKTAALTVQVKNAQLDLNVLKQILFLNILQRGFGGN
jgi:hypothetical protein